MLTGTNSGRSERGMRASSLIAKGDTGCGDEYDMLIHLPKFLRCVLLASAFCCGGEDIGLEVIVNGVHEEEGSVIFVRGVF